MSNIDWSYNGVDYPGPTDIKEQYGFVYKITNTKTGKFYIGCKLLWAPKYRMVNKKKKKSMVESDWRTYWSSSELLQADVKEFGEDNFTREIMHVVKYKGMVKYIETKEIILHNCLELPPEKCYNSFLGMKIHRRCVRY